MTRYVLLLRGINVGGTGKLPMAELRAILAELGATDVATYIQSGNAVLSTDAAPQAFLDQMWDKIEAAHGFRREALMIKAEAFTTIARAYPFEASPKTGHIFFHTGAPTPDLAKIGALKAPSEEIKITDAATYLHAPEGIGRSKLAAGLEKALHCPATARNLNTVQKLTEMLDA